MPYCGGAWVPPGTTTCPNGKPPTATLNGVTNPGGNPLTGEDVNSVITPTYQWNQDTSPVQYGSNKIDAGVPLYGNPQQPYDSPNITNVADAQNEFNKLWGAGTAKDASKEDKARLQGLLGSLRGYTGSKLGTRGAAEQAWHDVLKDASRANVDVLDLLGGSASDITGGGGNGSYNGPVSTVTKLNDKDARLLVDSLASDILGRAATEDEFKRAFSKLRGAESANPSVSGGSGASQTNVSGLSAEGRNDAITRALLKEDGAKEFTLATKMMGLFDKALQGRPDAGQQ